MARATRRMVHLAAAAALAAVALALPAGATQAAAPTAITGAAQQIGPTSALVNGTVNPGGKATSAFFEYGSDPSKLTKTASTSIGSGSADVAVSTKLTGLTPGTTYTYLVEATNSDGTTKGLEGTFTTLSPPGVVTGSASSLAATSATLNGSVDANGRATTWYLRVRHVDVLRVEDRCQERVGDERSPRLGAGHRPPGRAHLPLPPRRDLGRRDDERCRRDLHARAERPPSRPAPRPRSPRPRRSSTARSRRTASRPAGTSSTARARRTERAPRRRAPAPARAPSRSPSR